MPESLLNDLMKRMPELVPCRPAIEGAYNLLRDSLKQGGKILVCGNGGSASDSEHIVGELMKGFMLKRPVPQDVRQKLVKAFPGQGDYIADHLQGALPAISLVSHVALMTAFANDVAADMVFAQQVYGYGKAGDVVIGLSTSGNSKNVLQAMRVGRALGLGTVGFTGSGGGELAKICDVTVRVPETSTPNIQEQHLAIYHTICAMVERAFFRA